MPGILAATPVVAGETVAVSMAVEPPGRPHAGVTLGTFLEGPAAAALPDRCAAIAIADASAHVAHLRSPLRAPSQLPLRKPSAYPRR